MDYNITTFIYKMPDESKIYQELISWLEDDGICFDTETIYVNRDQWITKVYVWIEKI